MKGQALDVTASLRRRGRGATFDQLARDVYGIETLADPSPAQLSAVRRRVAQLRADGLVTTSRPTRTSRRADGSSFDHERGERRWRNPAAVRVELVDVE
jgi:hypothetical protein